jgi:hypothetical protein
MCQDGIWFWSTGVSRINEDFHQFSGTSTRRLLNANSSAMDRAKATRTTSWRRLIVRANAMQVGFPCSLPFVPTLQIIISEINVFANQLPARCSWPKEEGFGNGYFPKCK